MQPNADPNCIFCKIVDGQVPCAKILDTDEALAFLDIGPLARGHLLLIPKAHCRTIDELSADQAAAVLRHLPALVAAVRQATRCDGVNVLQNNGAVAHQVVQHVHFHIIPRNRGDAFHFNWPAGSYDEGEIEQLARAVREHL